MKRVDTSLAYILNAGTLFCCCVPLGVFGLYFAVQATAAHRAGDYEAAAAKTKISTALGAASIVVSLVLMIAQTLHTAA
jgi:hypothetical protein